MPGMADFINPQGAAAPQVNFQQAGQFQQTLNPQQTPQEGPPTTPQELEQRKSGWQEFMTKLQSDPAMRQAAILTATQMMRGTNQGESFAGGLGRALQVGTLAHGFFQGNQNQQAIEQQKLAEQQRLNDANIGQTTAQTDGLKQQQEFARQSQPLALEQAGQQLEQGAFKTRTQEQLFEDSLLNTAADRRYKAQHGKYFADRGNTIGGAKVLEMDKQMGYIRTANPPMEGETSDAYEQRIAQLALGMTAKNHDAVSVQAAQAILRDGDPGSPEYLNALQVMHSVASKATGGKKQEASAAGNKGFSTAAFDRANEIAKAAGKSTFQGPDGATYRVK